MCQTVVFDVECHQEGCENILQVQAHEIHKRCRKVKRLNLDFGGCGAKPRRAATHRIRAESAICDACKEEARQQQEEMYVNAPLYMASTREQQQRLDDKGRVRRGEEVRSGTPMPQDQPAQQLVNGAGTGLSAGHGGHGLEASGIHFDSGMGVSGFPQELDLEDSDEESDSGSGSQHNRGLGEGHDQQGGQGSSGSSHQ